MNQRQRKNIKQRTDRTLRMHVIFSSICPLSSFFIKFSGLQYLNLKFELKSILLLCSVGKGFRKKTAAVKTGKGPFIIYTIGWGGTFFII